jgi:hypothetical protein
MGREKTREQLKSRTKSEIIGHPCVMYPNIHGSTTRFHTINLQLRAIRCSGPVHGSLGVTLALCKPPIHTEASGPSLEASIHPPFPFQYF